MIKLSEILTEIVNNYPLSGVNADDAQYVWPKRWDNIKTAIYEHEKSAKQPETSLSKVLKIVNALSEIDAKDLDALSVEDLAQFWYWLTKHQGSIFVKSVGRLGVRIEGE